MMPPLIQVKSLHKRYAMAGEDLHVLRGIDMQIRENEYVAITGPSGSGKSTLMNIFGCLDRPTEGQYLLGDQDASGMDEPTLALLRNQRIGFIFQSFNLMPRESALKNVAHPLRYRAMSRSERQPCNVCIGTGWLGRPHDAPTQSAVRRAATACRHRPCAVR